MVWKYGACLGRLLGRARESRPVKWVSVQGQACPGARPPRGTRCGSQDLRGGEEVALQREVWQGCHPEVERRDAHSVWGRAPSQEAEPTQGGRAPVQVAWPGGAQVGYLCMGGLSM